jgi:hypothetical protein
MKSKIQKETLEEDLLQLVQKVPNKDMFHYKDSDMVNQNGRNHQQ